MAAAEATVAVADMVGSAEVGRATVVEVAKASPCRGGGRATAVAVGVVRVAMARAAGVGAATAATALEVRWLVATVTAGRRLHQRGGTGYCLPVHLGMRGSQCATARRSIGAGTFRCSIACKYRCLQHCSRSGIGPAGKASPCKWCTRRHQKRHKTRKDTTGRRCAPGQSSNRAGTFHRSSPCRSRHCQHRSRSGTALVGTANQCRLHMRPHRLWPKSRKVTTGRRCILGQSSNRAGTFHRSTIGIRHRSRKRCPAGKGPSRSGQEGTTLRRRTSAHDTHTAPSRALLVYLLRQRSLVSYERRYSILCL
jgi:hypothetical protein